MFTLCSKFPRTLFLLIALSGFGLLEVKAQPVFDQFDKNGDRKVTSDELVNPQAFQRYDLNRDGAISLEEFNEVSRKSVSTPGAPSTAPAVTRNQIDAVVKRFDANGDGQITRDEAAGAPWFERSDRNSDGVIDAAELDTLRRSVGRSAGGDSSPRTAPGAEPTMTPEDVKKITTGPEVLKPGEAGIGRMIPDIRYTTLEGQGGRLAEMRGRKGLVIAMTSATCPVSKRYLPSLAKLQKQLAAQNVGLLLVNPFASETPEEIKAQLAEHGFTARYVHDREKQFAAQLQARTTTEVFLVDAQRTLIYRGALDDQYGITYSLDEPKSRYLEAAVTSLLEGKAPIIPATAAPGCELDLTDAPSVSDLTVTYHRDVARILQQNCVTCHRDEGIAPFPLDDLEEVKDRVRAIKRVVTQGTMPPWFARSEPGTENTPWANDRSLAARDKSDLLAWIDSKDRPLGDPGEAPAERTFPAEWSMGTPDLIVPLSRAYDVQAEGFMPYAFDVAETQLTEDRWITAYEILPSERDVVHHVIVQVHEKGEMVRQVGEGAGGYWAVYVPGNGAHQYPDGFARKLPGGARVSFQIHYTPSGRAKKERLRMGLVFAKSAPRFEVKTVAVANQRLSIPPGVANHVETRTQRVPFDMPVTSFMAHMHVRGAAFRYDVTYADGATETLLDIPRYDFNWQLRYDLKMPKLLPAGSSVKITAVFDNSPGNRANPDPTKRVKWGPQTVDEMMIGYLEYFVPLPSSPRISSSGKLITAD